MTDIRFDLECAFLPMGYAFPLWAEIALALPWLHGDSQSGILPLKGSASGGGIALPKRAKLVLRIPEAHARKALELTGRTLDIGGNPLKIGQGRQKPIEPYPTLKSQLVESSKEEEAFLGDIAEALAEMQIPCKWICGRYHSLQNGNEAIAGYSLVVHDLKPAGSVRLQQAGLGNYRRYGCGLFVPHKTIAGLD